MNALNKIPSLDSSIPCDDLLRKNVWDGRDLGIPFSPSRSCYKLNFNRIKQSWLNIAVKKYIKFQSATKSYSSCCSYIQALSHFSDFMNVQQNQLDPSIVNRKVILEFIHYLSRKNLSTTTRSITLVHLRTFHFICIQECWLPWPSQPIIYSTDFPRKEYSQPRYIPNNVLKQLKDKLHHLPPYKQRLVIVLQETGRRISEVCTLIYDCLEQDHEGDWYLRVHEKKLSRTRIIPISNDCLQAIQEQQKYIKSKKDRRNYLFPSPKKASRSVCVSGADINFSLNELARKCNIVDDNGKIWHFQCHQFRHTVGTSMINSGVPQIMVQQYLGHESPEMTARYAHIHNETMKKEFIKYPALPHPNFAHYKSAT